MGRKSPLWAHSEVMRLIDLLNDGKSDAECAEAIGRSENAVQLMRLQLHYLRDRDGKAVLTNGHANRFDQARWRRFEKMMPANPCDRRAAQIATVLMLRDLKRAGMKPLESLDVPSERPSFYPTAPSYSASYCGSAGELCASVGEQ